MIRAGNPRHRYQNTRFFPPVPISRDIHVELALDTRACSRFIIFKIKLATQVPSPRQISEKEEKKWVHMYNMHARCFICKKSFCDFCPDEISVKHDPKHKAYRIVTIYRTGSKDLIVHRRHMIFKLSQGQPMSLKQIRNAIFSHFFLFFFFLSLK